MAIDYRSNHFYSLGHSDIWQEDQSRVCDPSQKDKFSEVFVHRDEDTVLRLRQLEQSPVAWIRADTRCFNNVVSLVAEPLRQPLTGASVYQELHGVVTETGARVSPAITVWA